MTRSRHNVPANASPLVEALFSRLRREEFDIELKHGSLRHAINSATDKLDFANRRHGRRRADIEHQYRTPYTAEATAERQKRLSKRRKALDAHEEWRKRDSDTLQAKVDRLRAERATLQGELDSVAKQQSLLKELRRSPEGLAPWDREVLEHLGSDTTPNDAADEMMKGAEVVALAKETLGISRSLYYQRLRPLLRSYHLIPSKLLYWDDGGISLLPESAKRFRRDEVEAMMRFVATGDVCLATKT